jgi:hypothetical protein
MIIKVGYCIAYDWDMLRYSIPQIYEHADIICLSIDKNRQSWTGEAFSWDEWGFNKMIREIDTSDKIRIYEDEFYNPDLLPMQNEVAQRNKIAKILGEGGWHVQLDADEYFVDFKAFTDFLNRFKSRRKVNICCPMINLYKQIPEGMLWIKPTAFREIEYFAIATQYPNYEYGRRNGNFDVLTSFPILHQSWARSESEIWEKLNNWGHAKDFDVEAYFQKWKEANAHNYTLYKNFHHLRPATWPALELKQNVSSIEDMMSMNTSDFRLPISSGQLEKANSIWNSRFNKLTNLIKGYLRV